MKYAIKANFKEYHRGDVLGMSQYTFDLGYLNVPA